MPSPFSDTGIIHDKLAGFSASYFLFFCLSPFVVGIRKRPRCQGEKILLKTLFIFTHMQYFFLVLDRRVRFPIFSGRRKTKKQEGVNNVFSVFPLSV